MACASTPYIIRQAQDSEYPAIFDLHRKCFGGEDEANLVANLRREAGFDEKLSFVLVDHADTLYGHVLFSELIIKGENQQNTKALALAPVGIIPEHQRQGLGKMLIIAALNACTKQGHGAVFVLGHPGYYSIFGFLPAKHYGITYPGDVPDDAFMALELEYRYLEGVKGCVQYMKPFSALG